MNNSILDRLQTDNKELKDENNLLIEQLKKLNKKLEEAESFKSHFLSNISNEIINPFTSILGISQNIIKLKGSDIEQIHIMSNLIRSEAFDLDFQLRNIFAAAKIESGENVLELVNINIQDFINEIVESLQLKAERRAIYCDINYSFKQESLVTDAEKFRMILINLIMNAITFSTEKNAIRIHSELNSEGFIFKINNQGTLISSEDTKVIFDRFIKLDESINSLNQGHGLGLSIIKDYVELLGGTIDFESNKKNGTTFSLSLPPIENKEQGLYMEDEDLFSTDDSEIF
ncbi:MAG: HAMP domain-containing sensor histidine kinase [Bacteroidales bacterium]|jgi:signal transduction histidine kinase|nr:HAMP domain-containing sensor histidine kinase [Bacteroidales bacterium]